MPDAASVVPEDLASHVIRVIANTQRVNAETISIDDTFEKLKIDSLDGINIVFALESEFHISVPDEAVGTMRSIRDVVGGVTELLSEKAARLQAAEEAAAAAAAAATGPTEDATTSSKANSPA